MVKIKMLICVFVGFLGVSQAQFYDLKKADDTLHLSAGAFIGTGALVFNENIAKIDCKICVATASALVAGAVKEWYDSAQPGNRFDTNEMLITGLGGVLAWALYEIGVPPYLTMGVSLGYIGFKMAVRL
ncbi:MAG: hypothetical protein PHC89_02660 [Candidatus Pacebacteria bacterium]|nr:hypothetical protein [Candidatus Paceibacterota bacterium]